MKHHQGVIPRITSGSCHLKFSEPWMGKVIMSLSSTGDLHLSGYMQHSGTWVAESMQLDGIKLEVDINTQSIEKKLNEIAKAGILSSHSSISPVENTCVIGGAIAYFDGHVVSFCGISTDFGGLSRSALLLCLTDQFTSEKILFGPSIEENDGKYILPMGLEIFKVWKNRN